MQFSLDMIDAIKAGRKTRTTRPRRVMGKGITHYYELKCRYKVGRSYTICPGRGKLAVGRIRVTGISEFPSASEITPRQPHAWSEGFADFDSFLAKWYVLYDYRDPRWKGPVWVIDFEFVRS